MGVGGGGEGVVEEICVFKNGASKIVEVICMSWIQLDCMCGCLG